MHYFAYGSNMSIARLRARVPSAESLGRFALQAHDLRFHKSGSDGSGKCDAFHTDSARDVIHGVLFRIEVGEKPGLDRVEGLGFGYDEKSVTVRAADGTEVIATTYVATGIDKTLQPFSWYLNHVLLGAREASLPPQYIASSISSVIAIEDPDRSRDEKERAIHRPRGHRVA